MALDSGFPAQNLCKKVLRKRMHIIINYQTLSRIVMLFRSQARVAGRSLPLVFTFHSHSSWTVSHSPGALQRQTGVTQRRHPADDAALRPSALSAGFLSNLRANRAAKRPFLQAI